MGLDEMTGHWGSGEDRRQEALLMHPVGCTGGEEVREYSNLEVVGAASKTCSVAAYSASRAAASLAQYEITMSAPARQMDTRASIITRSSSSQPRSTAAISAEYSPET